MCAASSMQRRPCFASLDVVRAPASARRSWTAQRNVVVRAEDEREGLSFTANRNAALGYTEDDSAGQSNVFAVEPKTYVGGSATLSTGLVASVAAVFAGLVVVLGLTANQATISPGALSAEENKHQTLSALATKFKSTN